MAQLHFASCETCDFVGHKHEDHEKANEELHEHMQHHESKGEQGSGHVEHHDPEPEYRI